MEHTDVYFRKGGKVILRPLVEEDIPHFFKWMNDPEVTQYLRTYLPMSIAQEKDWLDQISRPKPDSVTLAIVDKETGKIIGSMGMTGISHKNRIATTGASIGDKEYWGKGYGTEAKMLLLDFAFNEMNLRKIYSDVIAYNKRSIAYSEKCGYVEEARLKNYYFRKGKYWDKVILSVESKRWQKLWKTFKKNLPK